MCTLVLFKKDNREQQHHHLENNFYTLHNLVLKYPSTDKILAFNVLGKIGMR